MNSKFGNVGLSRHWNFAAGAETGSNESTSKEFGITISCYRGDYPLVKGCCASIRAHQQQIPICLITDGAFPVDDLKNQYCVTALNRDDIDPRLFPSYGYGLTKMIAFWHSPFKRFLHIDSDAVWWGDILRGLPWRNYDVIYNEPHEIITPEILRSQYFSPEKLFTHVPYFSWEGRPYFNTGCFVARKGILDLEEYLALLKIQRKEPDIFISGEQGILNYMIFRRIAEGTITARSWPLQAVVPVMSDQELKQRFQFRRGQPVLNESDPRVIHWAGPKPYLVKGSSFPDPMVHYRIQYLQDSKSALRYLGQYGLMHEEIVARLAANHGGSFWRYFCSTIRSFVDKLFSRVFSHA